MSWKTGSRMCAIEALLRSKAKLLHMGICSKISSKDNMNMMTSGFKSCPYVVLCKHLMQVWKSLFSITTSWCMVHHFVSLPCKRLWTHSNWRSGNLHYKYLSIIFYSLQYYLILHILNSFLVSVFCWVSFIEHSCSLFGN